MCIVYDKGGNSVSDVVMVTVIDTFFPTITNPDSVTYNLGETGNSISWTANDNNPTSYEIYKDETLLETGTWQSGIPITINIDLLEA